MSILEIGGWAVVGIIIFLLIFPISYVLYNANYTKKLMRHMSYSLGRELTRREIDQIIFRHSPMYFAYWMKDLEESMKRGVIFKMPPPPSKEFTDKFKGKIKDNIDKGDYKAYSLATGEELPVEENNYQKIIDEELEKRSEEDDNIKRYMKRSKMAGEKRKCLVNPKDLF